MQIRLNKEFKWPMLPPIGWFGILILLLSYFYVFLVGFTVGYRTVECPDKEDVCHASK